MLIKKQITEEKAYAQILSKCASSEMCETEVLEKLSRWGIDKNKAEKIIDQLIDQRFIDNKRYSIAFVNDKIRFQYWGKIKIEYTLKQKRIKQIDISDAIESFPLVEYKEMIFKEIMKKSKAIKTKDQDAFQKLLRFSQSRGYETNISIPIIKEITKTDYETNF